MTVGNIRKSHHLASGVHLGETAPGRLPKSKSLQGTHPSQSQTLFHTKRSRVSAQGGKTWPSGQERRLVRVARRSERVQFREKVFTVVRNIPKGKTLTYKEVARRAGNQNAARAVGAVLRTNFDPSIPCHRVIKSDGTLGGYNRGVQNKKRILDKERLRNRSKNATL